MNNLASSTVQAFNGLSIANIERLLLLTGSGNDNISNTAVSTDDDFSTGAGDDTVNSGGGNDHVVTGSGNDTIISGAGNDTVDAGSGNDTIDAGSGSDIVDAGDGDDTITLLAQTYGETDTVTGGSGFDTLSVNASGFNGGNFTWAGLTASGASVGAVTVSSSLGEVQTFLGSAVKYSLVNYGYKALTFDNIEKLNLTTDSYDDLLIVIGANGSYDGKGGTDALYADWSTTTSDITVNNLASSTVQAFNGLSIANIERLLLLTGSGNDNISNTAVSTDDDFSTGAGDDLIEGGRGNDIVNGGDGFDTASYASASGAVVVSLTTGTSSGADGADTLVNIEAVSGSRFDDRLTGNALDNTLIGNGGNDQLIGLAGNDLLRGGLGTDTLDGGDGNDQLFGDQGNDSLTGGAGNDLLDGGTGVDTMDGGAGNDNYVVDNAGDAITELASGGIDSVVSSVSYTLSLNVENLTLNGTAAIRGTGNAGNNSLIGNALRNTLIGGAGDDVLNGGTGADRLEGGTGDDTFYIDNAGDVVVENLGEGVDIVYASINYTLADNVENLILSGTAALQGSGNALANSITGNALANTLNGGAGNDVLLGLGGADRLDGGLGADRMEGGAGNDTYVVDDAGDVVIELAGQGTLDTVQTSINYSLSNEVERLVLTGSADLAGTGNALANSLTGNSGANRLDGGTGADILTGGDGADMFVFSTTLGAGNVDSVTDFVLGIDHIQLAATVFSGLGQDNQPLSASLFASGAGMVAAADAATRIVFDTNTGNLYYDVDGTGGAAAQLFATLHGNGLAALSADSFFVLP